MAEEVLMKSKEIFYRGKNLEYLKTLDAREVAKYLPSRSRRTVLRNFDVVEKFIRRCEASVSKKKKIRTHLREMIIMPKMIGMIISIHNGKTFSDVTIVPNMIGHRLGEFAIRGQKVVHGEAGMSATKSSKVDEVKWKKK